jgi:hypothetical protein
MQVSTLQAVLFMAGIVAVTYLLLIVRAREQVKKDLLRKGNCPISIRWRPLAYWSPLWSSSFVVIFQDDSKSACKGRCFVSRDFRGRTYVRWVSSDVAYLQRDLPLSGRVVYLVIAGFLIQFGIRSLIKGECIYQVGRRWPGAFPPIIIRGSTAMLLSLAAICAALSLLSHVAFHCDGRNRDRYYQLSARTSSLVGWTLFWTCFLVLFCQQLKRL